KVARMIDPCSRIEKNKTAAIKSGIYAIKFDCSLFVVLGLLYIIIKYIIGMITARTLIMIVKIFIVSTNIELSNETTKIITIELKPTTVIVFFFLSVLSGFGPLEPTELKKFFFVRTKVTSPINIPIAATPNPR